MPQTLATVDHISANVSRLEAVIESVNDRLNEIAESLHGLETRMETGLLQVRQDFLTKDLDAANRARDLDRARNHGLVMEAIRSGLSVVVGVIIAFATLWLGGHIK